VRFKIFIISSIVLLFSSILAIYKDSNREWKYYQKEFKKLEYKKTQDELNNLGKQLESNIKYIDLKNNFQKAEKEYFLYKKSSEYKNSKKKLEKLYYELYKVEQNINFSKSESRSLEYKIIKSKSENLSTESLQDKKQELTSQLDEFKTSQKAINQELLALGLNSPLEEKYNSLKSEYEKANLQKIILEKNLQNIKHRPLKIEQILIPEKNTIDRCITCHQAINKDGFGESYPKVFRTHPNREIYLVKHDVNKYGCVVCHGGQGIATTKDDAHGYVKFWDKPMFEGQEVQSSCIKCHSDNMEEIPTEFFSKGELIVNDSNCLTCHTLKGQDKVLKNAPPLTKIASKVNESWLANWVENPRYYLVKSKMPTALLEKSEILAISAYILNSSDSNYGAKKNILPKPEFIKAGKKIFDKNNCLSCHSIKGKGGTLAPDLSRVASKINSTWMFNWIKKPKEYNPITIMPQFEFSDKEIISLVSYLQTFKWDSLQKVNLQKDKKTLEMGRLLSMQYGCTTCHDANAPEYRENAPDLTDLPKKDIHKFDFGYADRDKKRGVYHTRESWIFNNIKNPNNFNDFTKPKMPRFWLNDDEANAVYTYIMGITNVSEIKKDTTD